LQEFSSPLLVVLSLENNWEDDESKKKLRKLCWLYMDLLHPKGYLVESGTSFEMAQQQLPPQNPRFEGDSHPNPNGLVFF
jgi:hypothetical protein